MSHESDPPPGFEPFDRSSPFLELLGKIWVSRDDPNPRFGIRVGEQHLNNKGTVHGGVVSTLADIACGYTVAWSPEPPSSLVTIHLATEFLGSARLGEWLQATGTVLKLTRSVASSTATIETDRGVVAHATALFHVPDGQRAV